MSTCICPTARCASAAEGFPDAAEISALDYNALVVVYRTGQGSHAATEDVARAIDYILTHAEELRVARDDYSVWGSSAGARMAAYIGSRGVSAVGGGEHPAPAAVVMAYTGHSDISDEEPPTFVVVGGRDRIAPPQVMERRIAELRAAGTEVEYHLREPWPRIRLRNRNRNRRVDRRRSGILDASAHSEQSLRSRALGLAPLQALWSKP